MRWNSMWEPTFCTTCRRTCFAPARNNHARKPTPCSASPVAPSAGLTSRFMFLRQETTAFFPVKFQRRVARERLGKEAEEIPGGHLVALSNPEGLTERLLAYERGLTR